MWILFFVYLICFVKIGYSGLALLVLSRKKNGTNYQAGVSVVVAAHNEYENLKKLLPALSKQDYSDFEVWIVLDRCTDASSILLSAWNEIDSRINFLTINELNKIYSPKKFAIIQGVQASTHERILCIDADCLPASNEWITCWSQHFGQDKNTLIGVGFYIDTKTMLSQLIRYETYITAINYLFFAKLGIPYMGVGRNLAFKKSDFLSMNGYGGFNTIMGGDDDLFIQQLPKNSVGIVLGYSSVTYSAPKENWKAYWRQKLRHLSVSKYYKRSFKILLSLQSFIRFCFWGLLLYGIYRLNLMIAVPLILTGCITVATHWALQRSLGDKYDLKGYPLYDLFYTIFVPLVAFSSRIIRNITWK